MNLREGTRRLALLLGVAGAILGGFASYLELQPILEQRASHNRFEQLAASPVVQQARRSIETACANWVQQWRALNQQQRNEALSLMTSEQKLKLAEALGYKPGAPSESASTPVPSCGDAAYNPMSEINGYGIKTVYWGKDYQVRLIQTDDGQDLFPTPAPSAWHDPLIALFPILGFFIPWGAVRCVGWVVGGFIAAPSSPKSTFVADEDSSGQTKKEKRSLVSRNAWIVISIISALIAFSNASKSGAAGPWDFLPVFAGGFIGGLLLFGGGWAVLVLIHRWFLRKRPS